MRYKLIVLALASLLILPAAGRGAELAIGDAAPDFELVGSDGKTYKLSELSKTTTVALAWFPKAFTGGCTAECKSLRANSDALKAFDVAYFTISCDDAETNKKFAESLELDYPILSDPTTKTAEAYGTVAAGQNKPKRWTFYIAPGGKLLFIDKEVKTANYGADVAAKLAELGVKKK